MHLLICYSLPQIGTAQADANFQAFRRYFDNCFRDNGAT
tara:strand:- start:34 stop:150 length:117 start_codon:yes stop_codon:yes gene_type:complete